ncbi:VacJ family lipoprotein [Nitrogeniibacter mangrovi]|uniref:VacJ family lipoprotein n=1 Tax=Nitrogeniibacter mangrovi TaxID=2016596 RepID=A0A6C1B969_9RHOO|nr:VacJ family lipoprotein [Nitrogeniibacter mangrovi]QID18784.1 VacJ family lipoprotein [Nitrogeniibacter mangrovi]
MNMRASMTRGVAVAMLGIVAGCATVPYENPDDPWERYNRTMFTINDKVDKALMKPLAQTYDAVTPLPVRTGVGNFFGNLGDVWTGANNLLQGKGHDGLTDAGRVLINSTLGIFGLFDVATEMGLDKHDEDFGQTLAVWGVPAGPYFVVPFFGPRTLRGGAALPVDLVVGSAVHPADVAARNAVTGLRLVHQRAELLGADRAVDQGSLDKYAYVRDFYLQRRRYEIYDGHPPRERFDEGAADDGKLSAIAFVESDAIAQNSLRFALSRPHETGL